MFADRKAKVERNSNEWQRCTRMLRFAWKPRYCSRLSIPAKDSLSAVWCKRTSNFDRKLRETNPWSSSSANVFLSRIAKAFAKSLNCGLMTY